MSSKYKPQIETLDKEGFSVVLVLISEFQGMEDNPREREQEDSDNKAIYGPWSEDRSTNTGQRFLDTRIGKED